MKPRTDDATRAALGSGAPNAANPSKHVGAGQRGAAVEQEPRRTVTARRKSAETAATEAPTVVAPKIAKEAPAEIDAAQYIEALRADGETEGLAAFNPPGTRPVQSGVVVPEDYELPEGFVRHYQTTDKGERLEAILTLSPDYDLYDENGNMIELSRDRIVAPEFAPPDLPVRVLELPSPSDRRAGLR